MTTASIAGIREHGLGLGRDGDAGVALLRERAAFGQQLGAGAHRDAGALREVAQQVRPPVAVADDAETDRHLIARMPTIGRERQRVRLGRH